MLYGDFICLRPLWDKHEDCSASRKGDHGRRTRAPKPPPDAFPGLGGPPVESDPWDTFGGHARSNSVLLLSAKPPPRSRPACYHTARGVTSGAVSTSAFQYMIDSVQ